MLCLPRKEAPQMASVRFTDVQARPSEFLDLTSLTRNEFQQLVPPFETALQAHLAAWRLDGKPRTARRFTVYKNCPLPTPEDRLFFMLVYLKTYALQVVHGRLFGMGQSKANQWIHVLLPALLKPRHDLLYASASLSRLDMPGANPCLAAPVFSPTLDPCTTSCSVMRHEGEPMPTKAPDDSRVVSVRLPNPLVQRL